ncbi:MAG: hypothetical protein NC181_00875 [Clostridium sp.]|nr:hypothetical protein [Clostridium sp.]
MILKKFSSLSSISNYIQSVIDIINSIYKCDIFVTDSGKIISYSGLNKKNFINQEISLFLLDCLKNKKQIIEETANEIEIIKSGKVNTTNYLIMPIITYGDVYGLLVFINFKNPDTILEIGNIIAKILETQVDTN